MTQQLCCLDSTRREGPAYSPFAKVVSLDWYDGTTSGLAECASCSTIFKYDIVDWDSDQERRIFVLARRPHELLDRVVETLSAFESPQWPFWHPRWQIEPPEAKERIRSRIDGYLSSSTDDPEFLVLSDRELRSIYEVSQVTAAVRRRLPKGFNGLPATNEFSTWMSYFAPK